MDYRGGKGEFFLLIHWLLKVFQDGQMAMVHRFWDMLCGMRMKGWVWVGIDWRKTRHECFFIEVLQ